MKLLGIALVVLGLASLVYQGLRYANREAVLDIGPSDPPWDRQRTLFLSPVLGFAAVAGGLALQVIWTRNRLLLPG